MSDKDSGTPRVFLVRHGKIVRYSYLSLRMATRRIIVPLAITLHMYTDTP